MGVKLRVLVLVLSLFITISIVGMSVATEYNQSLFTYIRDGDVYYVALNPKGFDLVYRNVYVTDSGRYGSEYSSVVAQLRKELSLGDESSLSSKVDGELVTSIRNIISDNGYELLNTINYGKGNILLQISGTDKDLEKVKNIVKNNIKPMVFEKGYKNIIVWVAPGATNVSSNYIYSKVVESTGGDRDSVARELFKKGIIGYGSTPFKTPLIVVNRSCINSLNDVKKMIDELRDNYSIEEKVPIIILLESGNIEPLATNNNDENDASVWSIYSAIFIAVILVPMIPVLIRRYRNKK